MQQMAIGSEEIVFHVEQDEDGVYNARALGHAIFTHSDTIEELKTMIREAVACHFDEDNPERPKIIAMRVVHQEMLVL
jgi:predicted RNase H-like HicB family nuclease